MSSVRVKIDGIEVEVPASSTVLEAANAAGVDIPYFCYHPYLRPAGLCRMCLVEIEGVPKLMPACVTQVRDGMVVKTDTDKVKKAREGIIEFQLLHHPLDCPVCDQAGECMLQDITFKYGKATSRFVEEKELYPSKFYGPLIVHEQSRCILCKRCVRFVHEVVDGDDWNVYKRASHSIIGTYESDVFANYFTCNLVDICPVGAITSRLYRYKTRIWKLNFEKSLCDGCSLLCSIDVGEREGSVYKVKHTKADPSPWICDRAYYGFDYNNHPERLIWALRRNGDRMVSCEYDEIVGGVIEGLKRYKPDEIAFIVSPDLSLEDAVSVSGFIKSLRLKYVDYRVWGEDYLPQRNGDLSLKDVETASNILVLCDDLAVSHPVLALSVVKAKMAGANVFVVSSYDSFLSKRASVFVNPAPHEENVVARSVVDGSHGDLNLAEKEDLLVVCGTRADAATRAVLADVAVKKGWKVIYTFRGANAVSMYGAGLYGDGVGNILKKVIDGSIKSLFILGVDLFRTYPDSALVQKALSSCEFIVVADMFFSETAAYTDYFLPIKSIYEAGGTYIDLFGKRRVARSACAARGMCRSVAEWIKGIAERYPVDLEEVVISDEMWTPESVDRGDVKQPNNMSVLFVDQFYAYSRYAAFCSAMSQLSGDTFAEISSTMAKTLGISADDGKLELSDGRYKVALPVKVSDRVADKSVVVHLGTDAFAFMKLLSGNWVCDLSVKAVR